ncbi:MAG: hypothetical protein ACKO96_41760, partial [Flammeovirgaceae bacterium]
KAFEALTEKKEDKKKPNIGEKGVDAEVHGFVASIVEPLPAKKSKVPDLPNGSDPKAFEALTEKKEDKKKPNIGEKGVDAEVHGFVASIVEPLPAKKSKVPD